jgi:glutathione synthase
MRLLFVADPWAGWKLSKDSTFALMRQARRLGWQTWWTSAGDLRADGRGVFCRAVPLACHDDAIVAGEDVEPAAALHDFDAVWLRTDPPFNLDYYHLTLLLELAEQRGARVINRPAAVRSHNEKMAILQHPAWIAPTLVTRRREDILAFLEAQGGRAVLKPLDRMGGSGIFQLRADDPNLGSILEAGTALGAEPVMVQAFLPRVVDGDKRIMLAGGEPVGAILRVPQGTDFRGNLAAGGRAVSTTLTPREHAMVKELGPHLTQHGLWMVGLDVIDGHLTEINVTSPTGLQEMERFDGPGAVEATLLGCLRCAGALGS